MPRYKAGFYKVAKGDEIISERTLIKTKKAVYNLIKDGYIVEEVQ